MVRYVIAGGSNSVVECNLAMVEVAGSNPVSRSIFLYVAVSRQKAPSPSGKAEVCKTSIPGSNPGGASIQLLAPVSRQRGEMVVTS